MRCRHRGASGQRLEGPPAQHGVAVAHSEGQGACVSIAMTRRLQLAPACLAESAGAGRWLQVQLCKGCSEQSSRGGGAAAAPPPLLPPPHTHSTLSLPPLPQQAFPLAGR